MYELAAQDGFHKPNKLPPWRSLPDEALSDALLEEWQAYLSANDSASLLTSQSKLLSPGGRFRPLRSQSQYNLDSASESQDSSALRTALLGDPVKVRRIRGVPVDSQIFNFASTEENAWIAGIRWSAMEAYLKLCHARAKYAVIPVLHMLCTHLVFSEANGQPFVHTPVIPSVLFSSKRHASGRLPQIYRPAIPV